jgi:hypothetical protein
MPDLPTSLFTSRFPDQNFVSFTLCTSLAYLALSDLLALLKLENEERKRERLNGSNKKINRDRDRTEGSHKESE